MAGKQSHRVNGKTNPDRDKPQRQPSRPKEKGRPVDEGLLAVYGGVAPCPLCATPLVPFMGRAGPRWACACPDNGRD